MILSRMPRLALAGAAAGGAAILIGIASVLAFTAGARSQMPVAAASPSPGGKAQAYCDKFVDHLAKDLGKSGSDVRNALKKAAGQTLDDAVKAGDLTKEQADNLRGKLGQDQVCSGGLAGLGRHKGGEGPRLGMDSYRDAAAKALGISSDELKQDLGKGMTLHQIADSKGISESQFRSALIKNLTPVLDQAVKDGKITKDQETKILQRLQSQPLPLWDRTGGRHGPRTSPSATT